MATFKTSAILEVIDKTQKGSKSVIANFTKMEKASGEFAKQSKKDTDRTVKTYKEFDFATRKARNRIKELKAEMRSGKGDFDLIQRELKQTKRDLDNLNKSNRGFRIGGAIGTGIRRGAIAGAGIVGAGLAAGAATVTSFAKQADEAGKLAQRIGFATETISELRFVVGQTAGETGLGALDGSLAEFVKRLGELKRNKGPLTEIPADLQTILKSAKNNEDAFVRFVEAAGGIEDIAKLTDILDKSLGGSGTALINFFRAPRRDVQGLIKEARELGIVLSDDDAKAAAKFNDEVDKLKRGFTGVGFAVAGQVIEPITTFINQTLIPKTKEFIDFLKSEEGSQKIKDTFESVAGTVDTIVDGLVLAAGLLDKITTSDEEREINRRAEAIRATRAPAALQNGPLGVVAGTINNIRLADDDKRLAREQLEQQKKSNQALEVLVAQNSRLDGGRATTLNSNPSIDPFERRGFDLGYQYIQD